MDIDGLSDEGKKEFRKFWDEHLGKLGTEIVEVADGDALERITTQVTIGMKMYLDSLKKSLGGLQ